ncbi:hypothetical protein M406DRAFT_322719, partial [Cryphonectria parasitica EP155]
MAPMGTPTAGPFYQFVREVSTTRPKKAQATKEATKEKSVPLSKAKVPAATKTRKASVKATEQDVEATKTVKKVRAAKAKPTTSTVTEV